MTRLAALALPGRLAGARRWSPRGSIMARLAAPVFPGGLAGARRRSPRGPVRTRLAVPVFPGGLAGARRWSLLRTIMTRLAALALLGGLAAAQPAPDETLRYLINWPSGLSLGEAEWKARKTEAGAWNFEFTLDASIPGFNVSDQYRAQASGALCSEVFVKRLLHGKRKTEEEVHFDPSGQVKRKTLPNGGASEYAAGPCARDALTFLAWLRREMASRRAPAPGVVVFGAAYQLRLEPAGAQRIVLNGAAHDADRLNATLKGPASETRFELYFGRDANRRLLLGRVPLPLGAFTMELNP
jgi:hypothetical protein